jgi:hypothetical protein
MKPRLIVAILVIAGLPVCAEAQQPSAAKAKADAQNLADGALGLWKAIEEVFPSTRHQLLLGSQDRQPAEHGRSRGPGQHEGRPSRDLHRADPLLLNPLRSRRALY